MALLNHASADFKWSLQRTNNGSNTQLSCTTYIHAVVVVLTPVISTNRLPAGALILLSEDESCCRLRRSYSYLFKEYKGQPHT